MVATTALPDLLLVTVTGPERVRFLQSQLTQDVALAGAGTTCLAGWADPKGRLLWAGHLGVLPDGDAERFALVVPAGIAEAVVARLRMFVLRAKVTVAIDEARVGGIDASIAPAPGCHDLRLAGDTGRALRVGPAGSLPDTGDATAWELADVRAGLPTVTAATSGEFVPQMVNLDLLGGVSFTKGCYPGQEIVARTRYLGRVKRRMLRYGVAAPPPAAGTAIHGPRGPAGQVVRAAPAPGGAELLAVTVLDDLSGPLFLDGGRTQALERLPLPYAVPEADVPAG
jgi:folate-binding protein YgfZ